ncbi:hypothetical protein N028_23935 [Pseudomonas syringae USA011]|nr:hypothetical protein N028_23935 [Pseudomonas syringae USA011]
MTAYSVSGSCCSSDRLKLRQMRAANGQTAIAKKAPTPSFQGVASDPRAR